MTVIGFRVSTKEIRYAVLEKRDNSIAFLNKDSENLIKFPTSIINIEDKLYWAKSEIDRILRINSTIKKIYLKTNEFNGNENSSKRETTYIDALILLSAKEHTIPVEKKLYNQLGTSSMRRDLEQLSIKGYCTANSNGNIVFISGNKEYRYEVKETDKNLYDFYVYQKNIKSGRETKASKFCKAKIKNADVKKQVSQLVNNLI